MLTATSVPLDMHGNKTEWEEKWMISATASPADILAGLEKGWAAEIGWAKTKTEKSRTSWKLIEKTGDTWNGWASVEPSSEAGKLIVSFGITVERKKSREE